MKRMRRTNTDKCPYCFSTDVTRIDAQRYQSSPPGWLFRCLDPNCGARTSAKANHRASGPERLPRSA
jgi:hypothetical protein